MGWAKTIEEERHMRKAKNEVKFNMVWKTDDGREQMRRIHDHMMATRRRRILQSTV
jgi:ribosome biogenesis protein ERB1